MITVTAKDKKIVFYSDLMPKEYTIFYNILGAYFNKKMGAYTSTPSLMKFKQIIDTAKTLGIDLNIDKRLVDHYKKKEDDQYCINSEIAYKTNTVPDKHQIVATNMLTDVKRGFIFGEVGTGKSKCTVDAIAYLFDSGKIKSCLYVCPSSLIPNSVDEFKLHTNLHTTPCYSSNDALSNLLKKQQIYIISYDILSKVQNNIIKFKFDCIAFDEVHFCKDPASVRSKAAYNISNNALHTPTYVLGFTGTEQSNNIEDVFGIYKVVVPNLFGRSITAFRERYIIKSGFRIIGYKNMEEFKRIVASVSIKFKLRDIADLPESVELIESVDLSKEEYTVYKRALNDFVLEFEDKKKAIRNILVKLIRLSQLSSGFMDFTESHGGIVDLHNKKLDLLQRIINEQESKVAIVCRFRYSIDKIQKMCEEMGLKVYIFDGRSKDKLIYKKFNEDSEKCVFITQIQKTIGYSIPSCKCMIFYELSYSKSQKDQAKGRILRLKGSEVGACKYIYIQVNKTIDAEILKVLKNKDFTADDAVSYVKRIITKEE